MYHYPEPWPFFLPCRCLQRYPMDEASAAFAERIFPATGINAGSSALPKDQLFKRMSRSEFVTYIRETTVSRRNCCNAIMHILASWQVYLM
jgi:hypothetical protein